MKPRLVFTAGTEPFELLVRLGTLSKASHAAIGIDGMLLHVHDRGVCFEPREAWMADGQQLVAEYEILPDVTNGLAIMHSQVGQPYDVVGAVGIVARRVLMATRSPLAIGLRSPNLTCAAFVMQVDPGFDLIPEWARIDRAIVAPGDLLRAAEYGASFERVG